MYARFCNVEILSSYIQDVSMGDLLTVQALVTNPLDWQHFYEKISAIKRGDKTDFMVVTAEGDRLVGQGEVVEIEKWSNSGHYGFKIKIGVRKQKSLTDRRTRGPRREAPQIKQPEIQAPADMEPPEAPVVTAADIASFTEMLKGSLAMDISA
jgi:hypothetical protein